MHLCLVMAKYYNIDRKLIPYLLTIFQKYHCDFKFK